MAFIAPLQSLVSSATSRDETKINGFFHSLTNAVQQMGHKDEGGSGIEFTSKAYEGALSIFTKKETSTPMSIDFTEANYNQALMALQNRTNPAPAIIGLTPFKMNAEAAVEELKSKYTQFDLWMSKNVFSGDHAKRTISSNNKEMLGEVLSINTEFSELVQAKISELPKPATSWGRFIESLVFLIGLDAHFYPEKSTLMALERKIEINHERLKNYGVVIGLLFPH